MSRLRQFGGTSNVWTGKWKHFQRSDFKARSWVADSEWPIGYEDLIEHYRSAAADYGFDDLEAEERRAEIEDLRSNLAPHGLKLSSFWWEKEPLRTGLRLLGEIRRNANLFLVLGATVTELVLDDAHRFVKSVTCSSIEGRRVTATASTFVLATGGLETPRLLLSSDCQILRGIGNQYDLVGRYYSDHPKHHSGVLKPGPLSRRFPRELQYGPKPRFCICFSLDDRTQRERQLLEHVVYLKPIYEKRLDWARRMLSLSKACRDAIGTVAAYRIKLVTEQAPNPSSRVRLGTAQDALGMRQLEVDWCFTEQDHRSLRVVVDLVSERFHSAGIGVMDFGEERPAIDNMTDAAHQMGTTKMASDPKTGVVDPDCRVFGTENLYVAGSAVFPTGPSYSPTFTILALARRLSQHLLSKRGLPGAALISTRAS